MGWSSRADTHSSQYRLAVCSYVEKYSNQVQIICKSGSKKNSYQPQVTYNSSSAVENKMSVDEDDDFSLLCTFDHPYPCTKVMFAPRMLPTGKDLLATTGDYLRLWSLDDSSHSVTAKKESLLNNNKNTEFCAPLASCDW